MAKGIGSYYTPEPLRTVPLAPTGARPVQHRSGVGAYYSPNSVTTIPPVEPGFEPARSVGLWVETEEERRKRQIIEFLGIVAILGLSFIYLRKMK